MTDTYYELFNLHPTATAAQIKTAYRQRIKAYHPDTIASDSEKTDAEILHAEDMTKRLNTAYTVLSDPIKRRAYDLLTLDQQRHVAQETVTAMLQPIPRTLSTVTPAQVNAFFFVLMGTALFMLCCMISMVGYISIST